MSHATAFGGSVPQVYHGLLGPMIFEAYARDMAGRLAPAPGERVLELACGTGIVTRELVAGMPGDAALVATDLNPAMLEIARAEVGGDARVTTAVVDACSPPFEDGSFDAVACQYGVMFFPDKVGSMRHARRVLRPGGRYVFSVWDSLEHNPIPRAVHETLAGLFPANPPRFLEQLPYGWSERGEIERTVRAGGFKDVTVETVGFASGASTAREAARAWVEGTPLKPALAERGVTDFAEVVGRVEAMLAARFGAGPCASTMRAVVVTAR